jgi:hypothetical protein
MVASSVILHSASNRISGYLAGKVFNCLFRPPPGGALPPGNYKISAPMHNSVYGTFALLTAVGPFANPALRPGATINKDWITRPGAGWVNDSRKDWIDQPGKDWISRPGTDWVSRAGAGWIENPLSQVNQPGVVVLVGKPLAGRNTIVIISSFSELMAALEHAGGAAITVS